MSARIRFVSLAAAGALAGTLPSTQTFAAAVPHSDVAVSQFVGSFTSPYKTDPAFVASVNAACTKYFEPAPGQIAPVFVAVGGIVVDWLVGLLANRLDARLQQELKAYTATYANRPIYGDVLSKGLWTRGSNLVSCVVAQRIDCKIDPTSAQGSEKRCPDGSPAGVSVAAMLRREGPAIRMVPIAMHVGSLKAKHSGGQAAVAATLQVNGFGERDSAGYAWDSGEVLIAAEEFTAPATGKGAADWSKAYRLPDAWNTAQGRYLALPPANASGHAFAAITIRIAEVGAPPKSLRAFSAFLTANKGDLSGALAEAMKKKLRLAD